MPKIYNIKYDVIIHFRCSDSPFNRHPDYNLLKYSWYLKALNIISNKLNIDIGDLKVGILFNPYHQPMCLPNVREKRIKSANKYYYYFRKFLLRYTKITHLRSRSAEIDFTLMYRCKGFIAANSSMSFMAGVGSSNITVYPSNNKIKIRNNFYMLSSETIDHEDVQSYHDVKTVHKLLCG